MAKPYQRKQMAVLTVVAVDRPTRNEIMVDINTQVNVKIMKNCQNALEAERLNVPHGRY